MPLPPASANQTDSPDDLYLIAAGTADYRFLPTERQLPSVEEDLRLIVELFTGKLGYKRVLAGLGENPRSYYFSQELSSWLKDRKREASDRIVFYYSGHGVVEGSEHYLMLSDSEESNLPGTAFLTANLGRMLNGTRIREMMIILDTCHAASGGADFGTIAHRYISSLRPSEVTSFGFYAIAAARPREAAREGAFSEAFVRAVEKPPSECGGNGQPYLSSYEHLVEVINAEFKAKGLIQRASMDSFGVQSGPKFIRNLRHRSDKVFLCHGDEDTPVVEDLARRLDAENVEVWLDVRHPHVQLNSAESIDGVLSGCGACMVMFGQSGSGPWRDEAMRAELERRSQQSPGSFRLIAVLLPEGRRDDRSRLPHFLQGITWVEFRHSLDEAETFRRLLDAIRGEEPGACDPPPSQVLCPYRGLEVFDVKDAPFFFGREAQTERLVEKLRPKRRPENRFLAIVGPSGSGKSSLARAGLLAALKRDAVENSSAWPQVVCFPGGSNPLESLAIALAGAINDASPATVRAMEEEFHQDPRALHLRVRLALRNSPRATRLVFMVDQFEELFTLCEDKKLQEVVIQNLLFAAGEPSGQTVVILTMRADFYGRCAEYPDLAAAVSDHHELVGAMTDQQLRQAIEVPARHVGCTFQGGLVDTLVRDVRGFTGGLPLLQHALLELLRQSTGREFTHETYAAIGRVEGALSQRADDLFAEFGEPEQAVCRSVLLRLVNPGEGTEDTRRRVPLSELITDPSRAERTRSVLDSLRDARLVTSTAEITSNSAEFYEISHEALIRHWPRLRTWIDEDRKILRVRNQLSARVKVWDEKGRNTDFLDRGAQLAEIDEWSRENSTDLNLIEWKFLHESAAAEIERLLEADLPSVPGMIRRFDSYRFWIDPRLRELVAKEGLPEHLRRRVRLALLPVDPDQARSLGEAILQVMPQEFMILLEALRAHKETLESTFWGKLREPGVESHVDAQLRAACVLAAFDPGSDRWVNSSRAVVANLVQADPLFQGQWIQALQPVGTMLIPSLMDLFRDSHERDHVRWAAAMALAIFAKDDPELLARLASEANAQAYGMFVRVLATSTGEMRERALKTLRSLAKEMPCGPETPEGGSRRAGAAIALMHLDREITPEIFQSPDDIEPLSQFVHRFKDRVMRADDLISQLDQVDRQRARFALLLTLGGFAREEIHQASRPHLTAKLLDWYRHDPSPAIHGAVGWVLRTWGFREEVREANRALVSVEVGGQRGWFVRAVGEHFLTFVVLPPGDFLMGAPEDEPGRRESESLHQVQLTRHFAVCDGPVTFGLFGDFLKAIGADARIPEIEAWCSNGDCPAVKVSWFNAVSFCEWVTKKLRQSRADVPRRGTRTAGDSTPQAWRLEFRLPTEAEWEYACRAGTTTPFSFGSDFKLLGQYAAFSETAGVRSLPVGQFKPNVLGLFDLHGNVYEWCSDWVGDYPIGPVADPQGPAEGKTRVVRGGAWCDIASFCRSAIRHEHYPDRADSVHIGFRLACTLVGVSGPPAGGKPRRDNRPRPRSGPPGPAA
jgi:formylglycine-generating enzyme required for sulfatase activity